MNKLTRTDIDEFLKIYDTPEKCRKFLQDAGIIGEDLKLTQHYRPDPCEDKEKEQNDALKAWNYP